MGSKRSFSEVEAPATPEDSDQGVHPKKKHKKNKKHKAKLGSINWVKKRARTIERRFQRDQDNIPETKKRDLEQELRAHQKRINEAKDKRQRHKMIKKYHMVRFFERKKAIRLEKQLKQRLAETQDQREIAAIRADLHIAEVDKLYTVYFPYMERYVSLYPVSELGLKAQGAPKLEDQSSAALALHSERPPLWSAVEKVMEKGQDALERLRDRRLGIDSQSKPPPHAPSKHSFAAKARTIKSKHGQQQATVKSGGRDDKIGAGKQSKKMFTKEQLNNSSDSDSSDESEGGFFVAE